MKFTENHIASEDSFKIIKYNSTYFDSVVKLFYDSYKRKKSKAFFNYRLSKTPYGKPIIYLMKHSNKIVGYHSIRPFLLKIKNKDVLGGLTYNTMTHPDYRNKGIFTLLGNKTHEEAKKRKYEFILGFASNYSIHGYTTKLKHKDLTPINFIKIKKVKFNVKKLPHVTRHSFPKNLGKLNKKYLATKKYPIRIERDDKFLTWRYKNNPESRYLTCFCEGEYFFIFKKYQESIQIIDFFVSKEEYLKTMIVTAHKIAQEHSCKEVSMWVPKTHPILCLLGKNATTQLKAEQYFHVLALNKKFSSLLLNINNWYYTMGDSDVF